MTRLATVVISLAIGAPPPRSISWPNGGVALGVYYTVWDAVRLGVEERDGVFDCVWLGVAEILGLPDGVFDPVVV